MKFLKVCLLASVYIILWGINCFAEESSEVEQSLTNSIEISSHIIPLILVDGEIRRAEEVSIPLNSIF